MRLVPEVESAVMYDDRVVRLRQPWVVAEEGMPIISRSQRMLSTSPMVTRIGLKACRACMYGALHRWRRFGWYVE